MLTRALLRSRHVWQAEAVESSEFAKAVPGARLARGAVLRRGEVRCVLEFLGREVHAPDDDLLDRLFDLGRKIGPALGDDSAAPPVKAVAPPEEAAAPDAQGG